MSAGNRATVTVRENRLLAVLWGKKSFHIPFEAALVHGRIRLQVPSYAVVRTQEGLFFESVHNGKAWGKLAVEATKLTFLFPISAIIHVGAHGREWKIWHEFPKPRVSLLSIMDRVRRNRWLFGSFLGHVVVCAVLMGLAAYTPTLSSLIGSRAPVASSARSLPQAVRLGGSGKPALVPFAGVSYWEYLRWLRKEREKSDPVGVLLDDLKQTRLSGAGSGKFLSADLGSASGEAGGVSPDGSYSGVLDGIGEQSFSLNSIGDMGSRAHELTAEQKASIRKKFNAIEGELKQLYSDALMVSPNFSTTVAFETVITPTGGVSVRKLKASGSQDAAAISILTRGMKRLLESLVIGKEFAGMLIRGENVFVH